MVDLFRLWFGALPRNFRTRRGWLLENLALPQQLAALKRAHPKPKLGLRDKLFWVIARRLWSGWKKCLYLVVPDTVPRWYRAGFRLYWTILCKTRKRVGGGKRISKEFRRLIFQMVAKNATWGAPRIHGELRMLGFEVSERTISRWMQRAPRNPEPAQRWRAFLRNHGEAIAAMNFFTVPTLPEVLERPIRSRMSGDVDLGNPARSRLPDHEDVKYAKTGRHGDEEVAARNPLGMVADKRPPTLRRGPALRPT